MFRRPDYFPPLPYGLWQILSTPERAVPQAVVRNPRHGVSAILFRPVRTLAA